MPDAFNNSLTWDELGQLFQKHTGKKYRITPMMEVADWAESRTDLFELNEDDEFCLKQN